VETKPVADGAGVHDRGVDTVRAPGEVATEYESQDPPSKPNDPTGEELTEPDDTLGG
jgi:hypothetical protein